MKPAARADRVVGTHGGALKVSVRAAAERGKANRAVIRLLADRLDLPESAVVLVAGETSQDKVVEIALDPASVRERLDT